MFIFSKGRPSTFNGIRIQTLHPNALNRGGNRSADGAKKKRSHENRTGSNKISGNIWYMPRSSKSGDAESRKHPATFPEQLAHDHIISWSNEGDTVFDPFMGSGTTGKMANELGRKFTGIEKVEEYYKISQNRLSQ